VAEVTAEQVVVPDIGDFTDVPVVEVLVAVGDPIAVDDPVVELESDKASFEVPSTVAGTVREVRVQIGDKVSEGSVLIVVEGGEGGGGSADGSPGDAGATKDAEATGPETVPAPDSAAGPPPEQAAAGQQAAARGTAVERAASGPALASPAAEAGSDAPVYASPVVRRLARERGIDLRQVRGTGEKGRITKDDVVAFEPGSAGAQPAANAGADALGLAPWPVVDFAKFGPIDREPLTKIQRLSAANLARNWVRIPHVTHNDDADITDLEALRKQLNAEQSEVKVTMVALLLKACARALQDFPRFNSSLDGDELVLKRYYHLGFAADTPNGLVVPVVRDVDRKGVLELAGEVGALSAKARAGKLMPAEMSGGTFSISSLGGIGGTAFTPIVNAPEVAILGVVRSRMQPVWDGQQFLPRLILPLSLSYDHRVIDGAAAARFTAHLARLLGDYRRILL
jgi:pyruvate dehydrogenase E2 component (dihydrolipoamide acetyltransferase)